MFLAKIYSISLFLACPYYLYLNKYQKKTTEFKSQQYSWGLGDGPKFKPNVWASRPTLREICQKCISMGQNE